MLFYFLLHPAHKELETYICSHRVRRHKCPQTTVHNLGQKYHVYPQRFNTTGKLLNLFNNIGFVMIKLFTPYYSIHDFPLGTSSPVFALPLLGQALQKKMLLHFPLTHSER